MPGVIPTGDLKYANIKGKLTATGDFPAIFRTNGQILYLRFVADDGGKAVIKEGGSSGTIITTLKTVAGVVLVDESLMSFSYKKQLHATITGSNPELYIFAP